MRASRLLLGLVWLLALALPGPAAAAGVTPTDSEAIAQADTVERAFDLLLDRYVHPLSSAALLDAAWSGVQRAAADHHAPPPGPAPALADDREPDFVAFRASLLAYLESGLAFPEDFVPAHAAITGMTRWVDEPHTYFLGTDEYRQRREWAAGNLNYGGIGVHFSSPGLLVTEVEDGSPAERAGIQPGDQLLQVDAENVAELAPSVARDRLRGPVGSLAALVVRGRRDGPTRALSLRREEVHVDTAVGRRVGDVAYIRLRGFPEPSLVDQFETLLTGFIHSDAHALILDLRGNAGGRLDLGTRLLGDFLPPGTPVF